MVVEHGLRGLLVWVVLIASISGCSLALSGPDPLRASNVAPRCDTTKGLVAADWVLAGVAATIAIALVEESNEAAAVSALTGVAFIASAVRGNGVVNQCRAEFAAYSLPTPDTDEDVARRERRPRAPVEPRPVRSFEDPYAEPADLPARRIVAPPPARAAASAPPSGPPAPAPRAAPPATDDDWADFWIEVGP